MNERVVEILVYIMSEIRRNRSVSRKLDLLSHNLIQKGYTESEISTALSWLLDHMSYESDELVQKHGPAMPESIRHLHEIEQQVITTEAYGYLVMLKELGIIDEMDIEQVIERSLMLGVANVNKNDIKSVVASVLFTDGSLDDMSFLFDDDQTVN